MQRAGVAITESSEFASSLPGFHPCDAALNDHLRVPYLACDNTVFKEAVKPSARALGPVPNVGALWTADLFRLFNSER